VVDGGALDRVFEIHPGFTVVILGLTIQNGSADLGGGIKNNGGTLTLHRSLVGNNTAIDEGGGIWSSGTLILDHTTVSSNQATSAAASGGGIYAQGDGALTLNGSLVSSNAAVYGGGINNDGTAQALGSTFIGNTAKYGGGIYNSVSASLTLTESTVTANTATDSGGGIRNQNLLSVIRSTISGNNGSSAGGGIYNGGCFGSPCPNAVLSLTNSTLSGNTAGTGGGVRNSGGSLTFDNCTVCTNTAVGGGISSENGTTTLKNSIVAYNQLQDHTTPNDCQGPPTFPFMSLDYNIISDSSAGLTGAHDLNATNPQLAPLAANGGPTKTHALNTGSPAIDAMPVASCSVNTDQRAVLRPQGVACDIGAYEAPVPGIPGMLRWGATSLCLNLNWLTSAVPWRLQSSTSVLGPWGDVSNSCVICNAWNIVTIPISPVPANVFFRLTAEE
jgi:predicted outer membrane repeat protein